MEALCALPRVIRSGADLPPTTEGDDLSSTIMRVDKALAPHGLRVVYLHEDPDAYPLVVVPIRHVDDIIALSARLGHLLISATAKRRPLVTSDGPILYEAITPTGSRAAETKGISTVSSMASLPWHRWARDAVVTCSGTVATQDRMFCCVCCVRRSGEHHKLVSRG